MVLPSQEQKRQEQEQLINQLTNLPTSRPNNRDQQGAFQVSSSQQNNNVTLHAMSQQKNNLQSMTRGQQVGQSQPMMSQQYRQQYPMQQDPQNRNLQKHLDFVQNNTNQFQAASSLRQTQNITDQQNQPQQLERANPSSMFPLLLTLVIMFLVLIMNIIVASQDSTGKTVNVNAGNWQEETYQKVSSLALLFTS